MDFDRGFIIFFPFWTLGTWLTEDEIETSQGIKTDHYNKVNGVDNFTAYWQQRMIFIGACHMKDIGHYTHFENPLSR